MTQSCSADYRVWQKQPDTLRRRVREAWLVLTGKRSLHRAWQAGYDQGSARAYWTQAVRELPALEPQVRERCNA